LEVAPRFIGGKKNLTGGLTLLPQTTYNRPRARQTSNPSRKLVEKLPKVCLESAMSRFKTARAILTDIQFWIPALVLVAGIALLVLLH
jgi:hypothetical protein